MASLDVHSLWSQEKAWKPFELSSSSQVIFSKIPLRNLNFAPDSGLYLFPCRISTNRVLCLLCVCGLLVQVNLCQKLFFLQNMGRTCCVQKLFWMAKTISVHNMFSPCSELGIFMYWTCNSMNNLSSYWVSWCKNKSFWQRFTCIERDCVKQLSGA